ncbi:MAG: DUF1360 domain-containing protein, partial [Blastocatellia bacterium]
AREDGPAYIVVRLRARLGDGLLGQLMDCFKCLSLWVAAPMALFVFQRPLEWTVGWLAISGAACLLEQIDQQPVVIQPIPQIQEGANDNGMLWTETTDSQKYGDAHEEAGPPDTDHG